MSKDKLENGESFTSSGHINKYQIDELREIHKKDQEAIFREYSAFNFQDIMNHEKGFVTSFSLYSFKNDYLDVKSMWYPDEKAKKRISDMLQTLKGKDREDFYQDILNASYEAIEKNSIAPLLDTLESWDATAEILLDGELAAEIEEAKEEFNRGEGIPWDPYDIN